MHVCMYVCMYVTGNAWIETNERACWALQDRKSILNTFYKVFRILSIVQDRQKAQWVARKEEVEVTFGYV